MSNTYYYFASPVFTTEAPEFLDIVSEVSEEALSKIEHDPHEIYPMFHSENYANDPRMHGFCDFVAQKGWETLKEQGYAMDNYGISFDVVWTQKHYKHSLMEQHVHPGAHLVGFYFLNAPENCSRALFHDPRPGKMQTPLPEANVSVATLASGIINFEPKPGLLIISNAWLPHSFGRHGSDEPLNFVHFNLSVVQASKPTENSAAEVV